MNISGVNPNKKKFNNEGVKSQKFDKTLQNQIEVLTITPDKWEKISEYLLSMELATDKNLSILRLAKSGKSLSDAQVKVLEPLVRKYEKDAVF